MQQTDILVIGGGIAGTATACYLAQYDRHVILLEQSELAAEASGLNAGTLWATGWGHTPDLSSTLSMGSLYYPHGGNANPVKTVLALASLAQRHGAAVLTHHEVTGIAHLDDGTYQVVTPPATFRASKLVLAAGPWCRSLGAMLGLSIPVYPVRGQMWATAPAPPSIFHSIGALESHLHWHSHPDSDAQTPLELTHRKSQRLTRHLYGRQTRDGEIIIGGVILQSLHLPFQIILLIDRGDTCIQRNACGMLWNGITHDNGSRLQLIRIQSSCLPPTVRSLVGNTNLPGINAQFH